MPQAPDLSARRSSTVLTILLPAALLAPVALIAGCATSPTARQPQAAEVVRVAEPEAVAPVGREESLAEASELVVIAREHARLGQYEEAEAAWNEALEILWPFADDDPGMIVRLRQIEDERDRLLPGAESAALGPGESGFDRDNRIVQQIIEGPEPELDPTHAEEVEQASEDVTPDYPVVVNDRVIAWVEAYSGRLSGYFSGSLARSGRYIERFREIFAEEGVPRDLVYLAHVESGFKTRAYSRAHAKGIFQFISGTGRRYGLRTDWWIDERSDPEKSCRAAASYLRDLYDEFGDWYLALASYNGGEGRVRRAIRSAKSKDFWVLSKKRLLRRETRNYVPAILAATLISKEPEKFGFTDVVYEKPEPFEWVTVPTPTDLTVLSSVSGADVGALERLNPAIRRGQTPPKYPDFRLRVPLGMAAGFDTKLAQIPENERIVKVLYRVRKGDTLSAIARRHGSSVRAIQIQNSMGRRTLLRIGQVLEIPRGPVSYRASGGGDAVSSDGWHRVRRGDTLGRVARRYGVSVRNLQDWNRLGRSTTIIAGQRLRVSAPGASSGEVAASIKRGSSSGNGWHRVRRGDTLDAIARRYGVSVRELQQWNGLGRSTRIVSGTSLKVAPASASPVAARVSASSEASGSGSSQDAGNAGVNPSGQSASRAMHVVRSGDTLWDISRRYGVTLSALLDANGLHRRSVLKPGQRITIPGAGSSASAGGSVLASESAKIAANGGSATTDGTERVPESASDPSRVHVVRRGENLFRIARRYGTTIERLCRLNNISSRTTLYPGDRLRVE